MALEAIDIENSILGSIILDNSLAYKLDELNKDMFSVLKKILVECGDHENAIAYLDDNDIICVEFPNGDIIKQA